MCRGHLKRWFEAIAARPATMAAYAKGDAVGRPQEMTEEAKKVLFSQTAASVKG